MWAWMMRNCKDVLFFDLSWCKIKNKIAVIDDSSFELYKLSLAMRQGMHYVLYFTDNICHASVLSK
jgi:hypothetical protein